MKGCTVAIATALVLGVGAGRADAQTCLGTAPITSDMPLQVGAALAFSSSVTSIGAEATYGTDNFFGAVGVGRVSFDELDASAPTFGITVGAQVPRDSMRSLIICPAFNFTLTNGPKDFGGFDFSSRSFAAALPSASSSLSRTRCPSCPRLACPSTA